MKTLTAKFKPSNGYTKDFIKDDIIPKLNNKLPVMQEATEDEIVVAVSSFFAHGQCSYVVDCSANPLFEEIRDKLVGYGFLRPDNTVKDAFRLWLPNSRLGFVTVNTVPNAPRVDTSYNTRYSDGSHSEVDRGHITLIEGYPAVSWQIVNPELQLAYVTGKQDQPTKQYLNLDREKLATTILKADKEELQSTHKKVIDAAVASTNTVWHYKDGLISYNLSQIEKAVREAVIQVVGKADFKFLAEIKQNNRQGEIETVESIGGTI